MIVDRSIRISNGIVPLTDQWQTVRTQYWYADPTPMVVVAQPIYSTGAGAVVRIRNVSNNTFEIRAQNPAGEALGTTVQASWLALPEGRWADGDARFEVAAVDAQSVGRTGDFGGQLFEPGQSYTNPVVVGQVQTSNDDRWSVFFARGDAQGDAPASDVINIGHHVGADTVTTRATERLGVVVFEAGTTEINGVHITAGVTDNLVGALVDAASPDDVHAENLPRYSLNAVCSTAGENGGDGSWPVLVGNDRYQAFDNADLKLAVDEDTIADDERSHTTEQVAYLAMNGENDGARFIAQATFGGYYNDIRNVRRDGYAAWIEAQKNTPISLVTPYLDEVIAKGQSIGNGQGLNQEEKGAIRQQFPDFVGFTNEGVPSILNFTTAWMRNLVYGPDQLRQRVAWSLSQIIVASGNFTVLGQVGASLGDFYDTLARNALGSFRTLIKEVSVHPAMAYYLSSLGNEKASADGSRQPDENYAREVMQLFTIGLWELNPDGTRKTQNGQPIPTYDNEDITNLARIFTGLWYDGVTFNGGGNIRAHQGAPARKPLVMFEDRHDRGPKTLLPNGPGGQPRYSSQGNLDGLTEINGALDALVDHPNTGPFIASALIRFLVSSNPNPGHVERAAAAFDNNGQGERGDLHAVVRQILLDHNARAYFDDQPDYGKVLEPMVRVTRMVKAFRAGRPTDADPDFDADDLYFWRFDGATGAFGQWPMYSPSVFNFFQPDFQVGGEFRDENLAAPEMQLFTPVTMATGPNELSSMIDNRLHRDRAAVTPEFKFNFDDEIAIAASAPALIERLNVLLCRGRMSDGTRSVIESRLDGLTNPEHRVRVAVWIASVSPEAVVLR